VLFQLLKPLCTNIHTQEQYRSMQWCDHYKHMIRAQLEFWIPLYVVIWYYLSCQRYFVKYCLGIFWVSIVSYFALSWYVKTFRSYIILVALCVALCPIFTWPHYHDVEVLVIIIEIYFGYWMFYATVVMRFCGKIKGVSIFDYILCLISAEAILVANEEINAW